MTITATEGPVITADQSRSNAHRWAQNALAGSTQTVVIAVETTDMYLSSGSICELAVIDTSGRNLLDTLINPMEPVTQPALRFHQIRDDMTAGAPPFRTVLPDLLAVTAGKTITAYHAAHVRALVLGECRKAGMDPDHLEEPDSWHCISKARSEASGNPDHHWPLNGGPRAIGICHAALGVLRSIATGT